jgi:hypothetical protein
LFRAKAFKSNVDALSDEDTLRLVKNRLNALTCLDANLLDIEKLAEKYEINREVLLNDYFGFDRDDLSKEDAFVAKLYNVKTELLRIDKLADERPQDAELTLVPRALIAIKLCVPLFYVNKIYEFLKFNKHARCEIDDSSSEKDAKLKFEIETSPLFAKLFKLSKTFFENFQDLDKLNSIVKESLTNLMNKEVIEN